jgi:hypothetical protein
MLTFSINFEEQKEQQLIIQLIWRLGVLNKILKIFNMQNIVPEDWYIDVGLEVQYPGHVFQ